MNHLPIPSLDKTQQSRFWSSADLTANKNLCWEWKRKREGRYATFYLKGREYKAPRVAYSIFYGKDPSDLLICHKCDNPNCINPNHLFLGTEKDNSDDKIAKGREVFVKGESHPMSKLSDEDVVRIKYLCSHGASSTVVGKEYGIGMTQVRRIVNGDSWKHLHDKASVSTDSIDRYKTKGDWAVGSRHGHSRMTEGIVLAMRADHKNGLSVGDIAKKYNIHQSGASRIINRDRWKHI